MALSQKIRYNSLGGVAASWLLYSSKDPHSMWSCDQATKLYAMRLGTLKHKEPVAERNAAQCIVGQKASLGLHLVYVCQAGAAVTGLTLSGACPRAAGQHCRFAQ